MNSRENLSMNALVNAVSGRALKTCAALALATVWAAALAACSGGGAGTVQNPITSAPPVADYTGPAPQNADVQAFKLNLWENIKASNRCGGCHTAGGQTPQFARNDDVNAAYQAANTIVNLTQPDQSRMVIKVGGGHNCWLASASACADTLTVWIRNWAGATATGGTQIQLQAPTIKEVGASKTFPTDSTAFASTIWNPILKPFCSRCHSSAAATPQSPYFAAATADEAYAAAKAKINLDNPAQSRFVLRLRDEFHNCWATPSSGGSPDCPGSSTAMENAITAFANGITAQSVDPSLVISKALTLYDGTVAAGGNRYDTNLIALYEFKTGSGNVAYDTSGVEPALNLTLTSADMWVGGWGINVKAGQKAQGSTTASKKLADMIKSTGEFTIEAWMAPANVVQEDAYAVSYSAGTMARNVTLAQRAYQYEAMTRTSETDANGAPSLLTNDADRDAQASLQHVVLTFDPVNGRRVYVNGNNTGDIDPQGGGGSLSDWDDSFALVLGNETSSNRQWQGVMRLVAIHNRALTEEQIQQNFAAGVGERYFLLFNVSHLVPVPQAYIMFEASQLDSYAYLFNKPTFISLDPNATVGSIPIKGVRIGVNGAEAKVGQTYIPLSGTIGGANYTAATGQLLSNVGAVIGLEKGPVADEFFLSFEQIGTNSHTVTEPPVVAAAATAPPAAPDYGVRTFDELNASMSTLTGVPITNASVAATFASVKQAMPSVESIDAFLASHQTGVAQLAIAYCSAMVDGNQFFGAAFNPNQAGSYFGVQGNRDTVIAALGNVVGDLTTQPGQSEVYDVINPLLTRTATSTSSNPKGAGIGAKAACAAVLGSAAITVQ
jgi:Concanavalin A-like lectin/glucanases superfamily